MSTAVMRTIALGAVAALAACAGGADAVGGVDGGGGDGGGADPTIEVGAEQEEAMCDLLMGEPGTVPAPLYAGADPASAPALDVEPGKKPIHLTDFEGQNGGYLRLTLDPALGEPVLLMHEDAMPFAVELEDGSAVEPFEAGAGSELCPGAGGRYTWFVSGGANYLVFGPTENVNFDLVIEIVE
jgi:hypothetical protein